MNFYKSLALIFIGLLLNASPLFAADAEKKIEQTNVDCLTEECLVNEAIANSQYIKEEDLVRFSGYLAQTGRFSAAKTIAAKIQASSAENEMLAKINRHNAEQALVLDELAAASWAHPTVITSYDKFNALTDVSGNKPDDFETSSNYWLLAEKIIEKFEPTGVSPDLMKLLRPKVLRKSPNATLDELLHLRWPQAIEKLPTQKQGELWNYMAEIYTEMGNFSAATEALDRAEQRGGSDFQSNNRIYVSTMHSWLELKNYDRALKAARQTDPKDTQALMKLQIAQAFLAADKKEQAHKIFDEAASDFEKYQDKGRNMNLLIEIAQGYMDVSDSEDARRLTDKALEAARLPDLFPAGQLANAARGYNNIGDHQQAISLLREAVSKLPDPHKVIGFGMVSGPISGSTLGVGDDIRSSITYEFYRANDQKDFDEQYAQLPAWHQNQTQALRATDTLGKKNPEKSPELDNILNTVPLENRFEIISNFTVDAINNNESEIAKKLLRKALDESTDEKSMVFVSIAKLAFAGGYSDLMREALDNAAKAAWKIDDKGTRAMTLAAVAASEHGLLN